ncbi:uncharacterized protein AKAME5_001964500, partial [Lates japonicus]
MASSLDLEDDSLEEVRDSRGPPSLVALAVAEEIERDSPFHESLDPTPKVKENTLSKDLPSLHGAFSYQTFRLVVLGQPPQDSQMVHECRHQWDEDYHHEILPKKCHQLPGLFKGHTREDLLPHKEEYLQTYRPFHEGPDPTPKIKEDALSKVSCIKTFLLYMGHSHTRFSDWLFLDNLPKVRRWSRSVVISGMKITTTKFYLKNAANFLDFLKSTPLRTCWLTKAQLNAIHQ